MKTINFLTILILSVTISSFSQKKEINHNQSIIKWTGKKIAGSHYGEIKIKSGYFEVIENHITAGEVIIDMNSITNTDLEDESYNQKLVGHLKSDDFFGVENFPYSSFKLLKADKFKNNKAMVTGVMTIKGISENMSFEVKRDGEILSAQLKVDRSKFNVRYGSDTFFDNLGDKAIDDIFILDIEISI